MNPVINCPTAAEIPDWPKDAPSVKKIVLGEPTIGDDKKPLKLDSLPDRFAARFPNLTHLHLWQIEGLQELPALPAGLQCLDVRGCPDLAALHDLPKTLDALVLEQCPHLKLDPARARTEFPDLTNLSIKGSAFVAEPWLHAVLSGAPGLRLLNASDCPQLTRIAAWPPNLVDARLDGCAALKAIPHRWPANLRRVGLRRASRLPKLPDFPDSLDYVDLAYTETLRELPAKRGKPRTLFLYGSGLLMPPASELGEHANENVAARTEAYYEDVMLTGRGEVKRCKLLILGNGDGGKTCLSLALTPGKDPRDAKKLGSTHGIQFWDWDFAANLGGTMEPVHLHLWDFGGQEIYHNTHRLFMSKGVAFIVVWKPAQDGQKAPAAQCGYQDEWRPLQYWLDFIHLACPHKPRIALVCSHHSGKTPELESKWREQVSVQYREECQCFYIDSLSRAGELGKLKTWLEDNVGEVIATQGTAVPAYWEIAQFMVEGWVKRMDGDAAFAAQHQQMCPDRFGEALHGAIDRAIASDRDGRYSQLKEAIDAGKFKLTADQVRRTLSFLTHSGWLYWNQRLFQERVIVGQKWALDGIYAVLDRRANSDIYRQLSRSDGRFSPSELGDWILDRAGYSRPEQELLLSLMLQCKLCFKLRPRTEAWRDEDVYVSFEHLPTAKELRLQREFDSRMRKLNKEVQSIEAPGMHKQHWQTFLTDAGNYYGKDAKYALDGLYLENEQGEKLLVLCHPEKSGLGGEVEIQVGGRKASERIKSVAQHLRSFLPALEDRGATDTARQLGNRADRREVFISYAWNPRGGIPLAYEEPVDAIEAFLNDKAVQLVRDKTATKFGDDLHEFMKKGPKLPHVIVVHSDKYWRSANCIFELKGLFDELRQTEKSFLSVVIPVEHLNSRVSDRQVLERFLNEWRSYKGEVPTRLKWTLQELKDHAAGIMRNFSDEISSGHGVNLSWKDGESVVLAAITKRLNLPARESKV